GKRAVADLQLDDVFALRFEATGHRQDIEGGFRGKALGELAQSHGRSGGHGTSLLLIGDRLRQGADDGGNDVGFHELMAGAALVLVGVAKSPASLSAPVLPYSEIDTDGRLGKLAGADLVGVGARLHIEPALEPAGVVER